MGDWDDDDFEPEAPKVGSAVRTDKWEGEDEDSDVKDEWDADSDQEKDDKSSEASSAPVVKAVQKKKKKKLHEIIAEKEEARLKELEEKRMEQEEADKLNTPEGKLEQKLRLQKLAEDQDLELAKELAGVSDSSGINFNPSSSEDFDELRNALLEKFKNIENSDHFQDFACALIRDMCMNLNVTSLKKVKSETEGFISAKLKEERAAKAKKGKPGNKATIKMETDRSMFARGIDDGYNDMDDFM
eukprot:TRINITY_DN5811_c0_g1_i1.p1 TRINITY_DN5811_c0_g1~~TRINITY_DN5811_c0_g1_i1.p1  ORF type:complete len:244 (-),score=84.96 TRINITY_DN5811_c0_g1_i1:266-997(-)